MLYFFVFLTFYSFFNLKNIYIDASTLPKLLGSMSLTQCQTRFTNLTNDRIFTRKSYIHQPLRFRWPILMTILGEWTLDNQTSITTTSKGVSPDTGYNHQATVGVRTQNERIEPVLKRSSAYTHKEIFLTVVHPHLKCTWTPSYSSIMKLFTILPLFGTQLPSTQNITAKAS